MRVTLRRLMGFEFDVGFVGAGNMGYALAKAIRSQNDQLTMIAADPWRLQEKRDKWSALKCDQTKVNDEIFEKSRIIFLCIKPQVFASFEPSLTSSRGDEQVLVSIIAGLSLEKMKQSFPQIKHHVRIMTNTAVTIGEGVMAVTPDADVPESVENEIKTLLSSCSCLEVVPERCMDGVTALAGSGIAFVYQFIEALADGGVQAGLPRSAAAKMAVQTVLGGARMVEETGRHPASLKDDVTSPAGTTIAGLRAAERAGLRSAVIEAVAAATERSRELSS